MESRDETYYAGRYATLMRQYSALKSQHNHVVAENKKVRRKMMLMRRSAMAVTRVLSRRLAALTGKT